MHYIRLLRPPRLARSPRGLKTELVLTITTDLGDSLLRLDKAIDLVVTVEIQGRAGVSLCELSDKGALRWLPGSRVAKPAYELPHAAVAALKAGDTVELCVSTAAALSADDLHKIAEAPGAGLVMPVWVALSGPGAGDSHVCRRKLRLAEPSACLVVEEELGESIARHIWDAGVVALAALAGPPGREPGQTCVQALRHMLDRAEAVNVLELGCGVGILGAGLGALCPPRAAACTILMTDLDDAAARARSNIALVAHRSRASLVYETLDWQDARCGCFGPQVASRRWDLVVLCDCTYNTDTLPTLVDTLSALCAHNAERGLSATKVFMATKPRHPSERAFFHLVARAGWATLETQVLPLPVLGGEQQRVAMYMFEKK